MVLKVWQKRGGAVAYQQRKKGKISNVLVLTDKNGLPLWFGTILSGNYNDQFDLIPQLKTMLQQLSKQNIHIKGVPLNMDKEFDSQTVRTFCFRNKLLPNGKEKTKRRRKRYFDEQIYKLRYINERTFAWMDAYKTLLIRFDIKVQKWKSWHFLTACFLYTKV